MRLLVLLVFFLLDLRLVRTGGERGRVEALLLAERVRSALAGLDDRRRGDDALWVEILEVVPRVRVDGPDPPVESAESAERKKRARRSATATARGKDGEREGARKTGGRGESMRKHTHIPSWSSIARILA